MKYKIVDHTADVAIKFFGKTIEELFINSAISLSEVIFNQKRDKFNEDDKTMCLHFMADDVNILYIDFLREILFQINTNFRYFYNIEIIKFSNNEISINCYYYSLNLDNISQEIKAVTYHNIEIVKVNHTYNALVTFDI